MQFPIYHSLQSVFNKKAFLLTKKLADKCRRQDARFVGLSCGASDWLPRALKPTHMISGKDHEPYACGQDRFRLEYSGNHNSQYLLQKCSRVLSSHFCEGTPSYHTCLYNQDIRNRLSGHRLKRKDNISGGHSVSPTAG